MRLPPIAMTTEAPATRMPPRPAMPMRGSSRGGAEWESSGADSPVFAGGQPSGNQLCHLARAGEFPRTRNGEPIALLPAPPDRQEKGAAPCGVAPCAVHVIAERATDAPSRAGCRSIRPPACYRARSGSDSSAAPPAFPGDFQSVAGNAPATPGDSKSVPGDAPATPGDSKSVPGNAPATPGDSKSVAGNAPATPGDLQSVPGNAPATPGDAPAVAAI